MWCGNKMHVGPPRGVCCCEDVADRNRNRMEWFGDHVLMSYCYCLASRGMRKEVGASAMNSFSFEINIYFLSTSAEKSFSKTSQNQMFTKLFDISTSFRVLQYLRCYEVILFAS